jgi:hypothetical protein
LETTANTGYTLRGKALGKICFSPNGDLFENNLSMQNLIKTPQKITLSDSKREENLSIEPSGAIY